MANAIYRNQPLGVNMTFVDEDNVAVDLTNATITVDYWNPTEQGNPEPTGTWENAIDGIIITKTDAANGLAKLDIPEGTLDTIGDWTIQPRALILTKSWPGTASLVTVLEKGTVPSA